MDEWHGNVMRISLMVVYLTDDKVSNTFWHLRRHREVYGCSGAYLQSCRNVIKPHRVNNGNKWKFFGLTECGRQASVPCQCQCALTCWRCHFPGTLHSKYVCGSSRYALANATMRSHTHEQSTTLGHSQSSHRRSNGWWWSFFLWGLFVPSATWRYTI